MGGSSTKTTQKQQIPEYLEDAFKNQLTRADTISKQGYTPYMGADTAAFAPQQVNAMQSAADWSSAFGGPGAQRTDVAASLPPARQFQDGTRGYSSFGGYENMLAQMKQHFPGQYAYIRSMAVDPMSGKMKDFEDYMPKDDPTKGEGPYVGTENWWDAWKKYTGPIGDVEIPEAFKDLIDPDEFRRRLEEQRSSSNGKTYGDDDDDDDDDDDKYVSRNSSGYGSNRNWDMETR